MTQAALTFQSQADTSAAGQSVQSTSAGKSKQLQKAISRWENEGGANKDHLPARTMPGEVQTAVDLTNAELVQLQVRVIALENLVIALLSGAQDQTRSIALALAADIYPRDTSTPHPLTIHAAELMVHMVERAALVPDRLKTN